MRAFSYGSLLLLLGMPACAVGGADDHPDRPDSKQEDFGLADTAGDDAEDTATLDDAPIEDTTPESAPPDTPVDSAAPDTIVDTGSVTDTGCTPVCTTCGAPDGCGDTCKTGTCAGGATCITGKCVSPTTSWLSPGTYPASWTAFAKGISWTMASEDPSTIRYTTDGSLPGPTSASGASPLTIFIATSGTTLRWFADNGAKETAHSFTVTIDTTLQSGYGYVVDNVKLDGTSPVVVTTAGKVLNGSAKYEAWVSSGCPGCREQLVYGIGTNAMGCLYDWSPGVHPGASGTGTTKITAPSTPGTYKVRVAWALQLSCTDATTTANPLGVKPTTEIGVIIVK